jgi:hypothetical protein
MKNCLQINLIDNTTTHAPAHFVKPNQGISFIYLLLDVSAMVYILCLFGIKNLNSIHPSAY